MISRDSDPSFWVRDKPLGLGKSPDMAHLKEELIAVSFSGDESHFTLHLVNSVRWSKQTFFLLSFYPRLLEDLRLLFLSSRVLRFIISHISASHRSCWVNSTVFVCCVIISSKGKKVLFGLLYVGVLFCMQCDVYSPRLPAHLFGLEDLPCSSAWTEVNSIMWSRKTNMNASYPKNSIIKIYFTL